MSTPELTLTPEVPEVPEVPQTPEPSPVELNAREQGWVSKEEWVEAGRDEGEWRPAKEFVDRGELYKSIHQTKRELKQTQAALDALALHHKAVYDRAYVDAMTSLKQEKRQAIREGDLEAMEEVEEKMEGLNKERFARAQELAATQRQQVGPPPEFQNFLDRNSWYSTDKGLRDEADAVGIVYINNGGDRNNLLPHVEKEMRRKYPEKLGVKRAAPSAVASPNRAARAPTGDDIKMDESEREVMRTFVKMGVMSEAQYKQELKKAKERG